MNIIVNGKKHILPNTVTLKELIEMNQLKPERVACEIDGQIIERDQYAKISIVAGNKIELIRFLGGG